MSVRKRTWKTSNGSVRAAWVVDYVDGTGVRRLKTFARKKDADAFKAVATVQISDGIHVADSQSATVRRAGELWITDCNDAGLERSTIDQYRQHLDLHIAPYIGGLRLNELNVPLLKDFEGQLHNQNRSTSMIRKVIVSLGSLLANAQDRGLVSQNIVRSMGRSRSSNAHRKVEKRHKGKLKAGVDIPTPDEIRVIVNVLEGRWRPILLTAIFTGIRASELRGLSWPDVDLEKSQLHIHQRADRFNNIGPPKSVTSNRHIPIPPILVNTLREWRLASPKGPLDLVFPNGKGNVESLANIINRGLQPTQLAADVVRGEKAKYTGMHSLRHFYASWCINRKEDGGLGLPAKLVQERLGHSSITMTMDVYGHLFPRDNDSEELAAAESALLS